MHSFGKIAIIFIAAISFYFISCKGKPDKQSIVGKWIFKELMYTTANPSYRHLNEEQKKRKIEDESQEAKETIFQFNGDKTFSSISGGEKNSPMSGTYEIRENDQLVMKGIDGQVQTAILSFPKKNTMKLQSDPIGIIIFLQRIE